MTEAAQAYEALFVPALFEQWTPIVAELAQIRPGERVLDVACGTGVLARHAAQRVGPGGQVVGLDPNPGMLAVARQHAPAIEWRQPERVELDTRRGTARFPSIRVVLEADLRGWLPMVGIALGEDTIGRVLAAGDEALAGCVRRAPGGVEFDLSAHLVSAGH